MTDEYAGIKSPGLLIYNAERGVLQIPLSVAAPLPPTFKDNSTPFPPFIEMPLCSPSKEYLLSLLNDHHPQQAPAALLFVSPPPSREKEKEELLEPEFMMLPPTPFPFAVEKKLKSVASAYTPFMDDGNNTMCCPASPCTNDPLFDLGGIPALAEMTNIHVNTTVAADPFDVLEQHHYYQQPSSPSWRQHRHLLNEPASPPQKNVEEVHVETPILELETMETMLPQSADYQHQHPLWFEKMDVAGRVLTLYPILLDKLRAFCLAQLPDQEFVVDALLTNYQTPLHDTVMHWFCTGIIPDYAINTWLSVSHPEVLLPIVIFALSSLFGTTNSHATIMPCGVNIDQCHPDHACHHVELRPAAAETSISPIDSICIWRIIHQYCLSYIRPFALRWGWLTEPRPSDIEVLEDPTIDMQFLAPNGRRIRLADFLPIEEFYYKTRLEYAFTADITRQTLDYMRLQAHHHNLTASSSSIMTTALFTPSPPLSPMTPSSLSSSSPTIEFLQEPAPSAAVAVVPPPLPKAAATTTTYSFSTKRATDKCANCGTLRTGEQMPIHERNMSARAVFANYWKPFDRSRSSGADDDPSVKFSQFMQRLYAFENPMDWKREKVSECASLHLKDALCVCYSCKNFALCFSCILKCDAATVRPYLFVLGTNDMTADERCKIRVPVVLCSQQCYKHTQPVSSGGKRAAKSRSRLLRNDPDVLGLRISQSNTQRAAQLPITPTAK